MNQEQIKRMEDAIAADYTNMVGMVIVKDGETVYENYYNGCSADSRIHVFSVTKSIVSILIGIAIDKGLIKSIDDKVLDYYPDYIVKRGEKTLPEIRIRDILTMSVPYKYKFNPYTKYFTSMDWVKFSLDKMGGRGNIGEFRYAPIIATAVFGILALICLVKWLGCFFGWIKRGYLDDEISLNSKHTGMRKYFDFCIRWIVPPVMLMVLLGQISAFFGLNWFA